MQLDSAWGLEQTRLRSMGAFVPDRGDPLRTYRVGPHADWVGRAIASLPTAPADPDRSATLENEEAWDDVDLAADPLPSYATGWLDDPSGTTEKVVVSLNGVVAGVSPLSAGERPGQYAALLPPALLRTGRNTVELYGVGADGRLSPIPSGGTLVSSRTALVVDDRGTGSRPGRRRRAAHPVATAAAARRQPVAGRCGT